MRILLTGAEGYIGSILGPMLVARGHDVLGVDTGFFRVDWLYNPGRQCAPAVQNRDVRQLEAMDLEGFDAVAHLAEISNDPMGELKPDITYAINHRGTAGFAERCAEAGVPRFVFSSSCSTYGLGSDALRTEESPTDPQTAYARCKILVEDRLHELAGDGFSPVILRNATAFGISPRMRFDLVLNNLAGHAWTSKEIRMTSDGTPWRPLIHVRDIAHAFVCALEAPRDTVHDEVFNVGDTAQNYQVREVAERVAEAFPGCKLSFGRSDGDTRSYRVSFDKIHERLPGFACHTNVEQGAEELRTLFERIQLSRESFESRAYTRLRQLQFLMKTEQIDDDFLWRSA